MGIIARAWAHCVRMALSEHEEKTKSGGHRVAMDRTPWVRCTVAHARAGRATALAATANDRVHLARCNGGGQMGVA